MSKNISELSHRLGFQNNLFSSVAGTIQMAPENTRAVMDRLAERARLSESVLNGTASFYDFLNEEAKAREVHVCQGTACLVNGSSAAAASRYPGSGRVMCCGYCYQGAGLLKRDAEGDLDGYHHTDKGLSHATMPVYSFSRSAILTAPVESIEQQPPTPIYVSIPSNVFIVIVAFEPVTKCRVSSFSRWPIVASGVTSFRASPVISGKRVAFPAAVVCRPVRPMRLAIATGHPGRWRDCMQYHGAHGLSPGPL